MIRVGKHLQNHQVQPSTSLLLWLTLGQDFSYSLVWPWQEEQVRFGGDMRNRVHLWGLSPSRRWRWGVKKRVSVNHSSLLRRGTHWKGPADETRGRPTQNKTCRHSSHCGELVNDCCACACVCRRLSRKGLLSLLTHIPSPWVNFLRQKSAQK